MARLELIMTENKPLTADDARALLSAHLEGELPAELRAEVDALLAQDAALRAEHDALKGTLSLLRALPQPAAPASLLVGVQQRLAAERAAQGGASVTAIRPPARRAPWGAELVVGLAVAAGIAVVVGVAGMPRGGGGQAATATAGLALDAAPADTTLRAPGFPRYVVTGLASKAGMETVVGDTYEGDRRAAARFLFALKETAVARGVEVSGVIPETDRVRVTVDSAPSR